jgi:hypothetical protein
MCREDRFMKRSWLVIVLSALVLAAALLALPAPHGAKAAATAQIVSKTPVGDTVKQDVWNGVVKITYDKPVQFGTGLVRVYWRHYDTSTHTTIDSQVWSDWVDQNNSGGLSISADGCTVTIDADWANSDFYGDKYNSQNDDYKYHFWIQADSGTIISQADGSNAQYWGDHNWNIYVQATPPEVVSTYPDFYAGGVIARSGMVFSVTFDGPVLKMTGHPIIYKNNFTQVIDCYDFTVSGNTLSITLPQTLDTGTVYGIMLPGPDNVNGPDTNFIQDDYWTPFGGIDYPPSGTGLPYAGCWSFTTAVLYDPPVLESTSPAAGTLHVDPNGDLTMTFDQGVFSNTDSSKYVYIKRYSDNAVIKQILNTDILAEGTGSGTLTISGPGLSKNTQYYVNIDAGAFEGSGGLPYAGLSDKSWYFTTIETYQVKFYVDGTQYGATQTVDYMGDAAAPADPSKSGFVFIGWDKPFTNVTSNLNVNAVFKQLFTLSYGAGANGHIEGITSQEVAEGDDGTTVTAAADSHYHFDHWSDGYPTAVRTDTNVTGDINATAYFAIDTFTLDYDTDGNGTLSAGGSTGLAVYQESVDYDGDGTTVTAVPDTGYHFVQWSDGVTTAGRTDTNVTADLSVTAVFEINTYTLTYTAGEHGTLTGDLDQCVEYGGSGTQVIAVPDDHYHFAGWSDGLATSYRTDTDVTGDIDVNTEFEINKYKVTFEDYDGTVLKTQYVAYGSDAAPPRDPEKEGYTFTGWDGDYYDITAATTVTAEYEINTYKVTFADYDGTELKVQNVNYGGSAVPPADPAREGYIFAGWDGDYTKITGTVTFTAQYEADTFKVTFADYDGSVIDEQDVEYGKDALAPADPVREGYVFTGWDKEFSGVTADITVNAQYKAALTVTEAGTQDGSPAVIVDTGDLDVTGASVEGGKAKVNKDGTITLEFPNGVKAGAVEVTLTLAGGTTVVQTVMITDEAIAATAPQADSGTPLWLWIVIGALAAIAAVLVIIFARRLRQAR